MKSEQFQSPIVVAFARYGIEEHVAHSLRLAWQLSEGKPLDASQLLKAALISARTRKSEAFRKFASLANVAGLESPESHPRKRLPPLDLGAVPVVRPLAESYAAARPYLENGKRIWGRDFLTIALLALEDPSLGEFEDETGLDMESLRRDWFEFLTSTDQHRDPDQWRKWWRIVQTDPVPSDADKNSLPDTAYLLTWNPGQFRFEKLEEHVAQIDSGDVATFPWSTGNRKNIEQGSRVFLISQGRGARGLVGVGRVVSDVMEKPHWRAEDRAAGRKSLLVDVEWEALSRDPFIEQTRLIERTGDIAIWAAQASGTSIAPEISAKLEQIWPAAWQRYRSGDSDLPVLEHKNLIALLEADTGKSRDSLNIDRYVDAFARVMASRNLTPPLSIGLFGDWGSGKTFFMERLEDRIANLITEGNGKSELYWPNICQIRFNAWHYAETNLWASLVSTIFNRLRVHLDGESEDADEFNKLLQQLELAGELRAEAEERMREAEEQNRLAREAVKAASKQLKNLPPPPEPTDEQVREILAKALHTAVAKKPEEIAGLLDSAADWTDRDDFREAAARIREGAQTVEQAEAVLAEARNLSTRAGFWWRILSTAKLYKSKAFWGIVVILLAIPGLLWWGQAQFGPFGTMADIWAIIAEVLTASGASVAWVRSRLGKAGPVFDRLDSLQAEIQREIANAGERDRLRYDRLKTEADAARQAAEDELAERRREQKAAAEAERAARKAVQESTSQARLGRFIRERAASADYEKHLGLIAMIHRDFSQLSKLMQKAQDDNSQDSPRVDRIILYIDDLDRCHPPEQVVRVLEAVHLLLFFPLFVVVVGVDSRWVSRALYKHYEDMLADETMTIEGSDNSLHRPPADSQDFLEKIFQVPFWLRRMDPNAVKRMIHNMISDDELITFTQDDEEQIADEIDDTMNDPTLSVADSEPPVSTTRDSGKVAAKSVTAEAESDAKTMGEPLAAPTETLTITDSELAFMDEVAPLMPRTPRSVKRFVNIYRLYKSALSSSGLARFLGSKNRPGNHRAVQVLLALVTGSPRIARRVFDRLQEGEQGGFNHLEDLVQSLEEIEEDALNTVDSLREFSGKHKDLTYKELKEVSYLVSRYSVHHMVSRAPGQTDLE